MQAGFWKLSQGGDDFAAQDALLSIEERLAYHKDVTPQKNVHGSPWTPVTSSWPS
jgi:hypothetical protein